MSEIRVLSRFGFVGAAGFFVDGLLLTALTLLAGFGVYLARAISFGVAVIVTWALNRVYVFEGKQSSDEGAIECGQYFLVQSLGALINLGVFVLLVASWPHLSSFPVVPLALGSAVALIFNFLGSRYWVFKKVRASE